MKYFSNGYMRNCSIILFTAFAGGTIAVEGFAPLSVQMRSYLSKTMIKTGSSSYSSDHPLMIIIGSSCLNARRRNPSSDDNDDDYDITEEKNAEIPQLPPSSLSSRSTSTSLSGDTDTKENKAFVAHLKKLQLQYTCNICETRNCHMVSRIAYNNGVVIARCKGCQSQHLIADHLGYCDYKGGFEGDTNTIEDYFSNNSKEQQQVVNRVSQEVFDLEKMLGQYDMESGSIIGEDGKLAME
jgi:hypothetical protein